MRNGYLILACILLATACHGQRNQKKMGFNQSGRRADNFLHKQWWLGFRAGSNLSRALVETPYDVVSPTNYDATEIAKEYENFKSPGIQVSFEITYYFKGLSVSFQPAYRTNWFVYINKFEWSDDENPENRLLLDYRQEQKITYVDWPLLAKYEFSSGNVKPYIQLGLYSSLMIDATKRVTMAGVDYASGGVNHFDSEPIIVGAADLFAKYHWGLTGGGGIYYPLGNVRLNLDITWRHGMSNISSTQNRFGSDRLSGVGDSLDDMKLNNVALSIGCLFPLRFLGSGFRSMTEK